MGFGGDGEPGDKVRHGIHKHKHQHEGYVMPAPPVLPASYVTLFVPQFFHL